MDEKAPKRDLGMLPKRNLTGDIRGKFVEGTTHLKEAKGVAANLYLSES